MVYYETCTPRRMHFLPCLDGEKERERVRERGIDNKQNHEESE